VFEATEAYNHVARTSPEFGTMLYELASVYVRLGDVQRAQRALEVLAIADPDSADIAEGTLPAVTVASIRPVCQGAEAFELASPSTIRCGPS